MLTINLQTVQKWLNKVGLLMVVSFSETTYTLHNFYLLWSKDWEEKFGETNYAKDKPVQPRLPGLD